MAGFNYFVVRGIGGKYTFKVDIEGVMTSIRAIIEKLNSTEVLVAVIFGDAFEQKEAFAKIVDLGDLSSNQAAAFRVGKYDLVIGFHTETDTTNFNLL